MKGVLLAGGEGSRLGQLTAGKNKHLLLVRGETMISYGIRKMAAAGLEELLLVTGSRHLADFEDFLERNPFPGLSIHLVPQERPGGIGEALALCGRLLGDPAEPIVLLLGDNLFEQALPPLIQSWRSGGHRARIHLSLVDDPERFGIASLDPEGRLAHLSEKPTHPDSRLAVTGLYFLPAEAAEVARRTAPSPRGEVEMIAILRHYLEAGELDHALLGGWWVDSGTPEGLALAEKLLAPSDQKEYGE
ncbi:MAG: sugar nucleotidyltransferase [Planctomycetes bacterium]|nr:sugar nucleotidyltransferase [Planctomycetota bacterium]